MLTLELWWASMHECGGLEENEPQFLQLHRIMSARNHAGSKRRTIPSLSCLYLGVERSNEKAQNNYIQ
jgi:hypothetical protein